MYRGTTPTFTFNLPIEAGTITKLMVAFRQIGTAVSFEKDLSECTLSENTVSCSLTEEETLELKAGYRLQIQLRVGVGEARMASQIFTVPVEHILKGGVL